MMVGGKKARPCGAGKRRKFCWTFERVSSGFREGKNIGGREVDLVVVPRYFTTYGVCKLKP